MDDVAVSAALVRSSVLGSVSAAPAPRTLVDLFHSTAGNVPDEPALDDGTTVLTYRELVAAANGVADRLRAAGVGRGDRVGVQLPSGSCELYVAILGVLTAGAAYVPVDADDPPERARLVFADAAVRMVLGPDAPVPHPTTSVPNEATSRPRHRPTPGDDAWIIFTSGSTGTPKGVAVTHRSAAAFVDAEARLFLLEDPIGPGDRVLAGLSVAFDASCEEMT